MIKTAILHVNYGPYHLARIAGLAQSPYLEPFCVQIAPRQEKYPWTPADGLKKLPLITISDQPYERSAARRLLVSTIRALNQIDPDVVVPCGYSDYPMLGAILWARARRRPVVLMFETSELDRARSRLREAVKGTFLRFFVDAFFCGGEAHSRYLNRLGIPDNRIWKQYDVVDNDYFQRGKNEVLIEATCHTSGEMLPDRYFLYVGRFSPEKNLLCLLEAYGRYRQMEPGGWGLVMVGDGPQRQDLQAVAREGALPGVVWTGFKQLDQLHGYYAQASCFVLPSLVEPWGLVVNEAMASGLPVLVSNRAGCAPDLVHEGVNGFTFDPTSPEQLARLLRTVAGLAETARADMGRRSEEIIRGYSPQAWCANLTGAVRAVARSSRGHRE